MPAPRQIGTLWAGWPFEFERPGQPPRFQADAVMGYFADGPGLLDGDAASAGYVGHVSPGTPFQIPPGSAPANDEGRLVIEWDGRFRDEPAYSDVYGALGLGAVQLQDDDPAAYMMSMWPLVFRVEGGDIDRRDTVTPPSDTVDIVGDIVEAVVLGARPEKDAEIVLEAPEGWRAFSAFRTHTIRVETDSDFRFEDGSGWWGISVEDGEHWLESGTGADGFETWAWTGNAILLLIREDQATGVRPPVSASYTEFVPEGGVTFVQFATRDGIEQEFELGPGIHTFQQTEDGLELVERLPVPQGLR